MTLACQIVPRGSSFCQDKEWVRSYGNLASPVSLTSKIDPQFVLLAQVYAATIPLGQTYFVWIVVIAPQLTSQFYL